MDTWPNHGRQMVSVEMFTEDLVERWSELPLMDSWEKKKKKQRERK